jgi:transposase
MGAIRRQFTQEFKLAAVRRLEQGVPMAEVARGLEVSPNVLHRWRKEFRQGPGNAFPGNGKQRWAEGRVADLERKVKLVVHTEPLPRQVFVLAVAKRGSKLKPSGSVKLDGECKPVSLAETTG